MSVHKSPQPKQAVWQGLRSRVRIRDSVGGDATAADELKFPAESSRR